MSSNDQSGTSRPSTKPVETEIPRSERRFLAYLVALVAVLIAIGVRSWLDPLFGESFPFVTFIFAVIFSAWFGGMGPSLLALVVGFFAAGFFLHPRGSPAIYQWNAQVGTGLYVIVGLSTIFLSELMHRARRQANNNASLLRAEKSRLEIEVRERGEIERAYANLLKRFVNLQEDERHLIAHELHDHVGQDLVAIRLKLQRILAQNSDPPTRIGVNEVIAILDKLSQSFRRLTFNLRPPMLDELGLGATLESYLEEWQQTTCIHADLAVVGLETGKTSTEIDTVLYRVITEALNNVAKHSHSSKVSVVVERRESGIQAIVEDQGRGFDLEGLKPHLKKNSCLGLLGMQERLNSIGGRLDVETEIDGGTTVFVRIPLNHSQA